MAKKPAETNPFIQALQIEGYWRMSQVETKSNGEPGSNSSMATVKLIDRDDRCSVYGKGLMGWFQELSTSAKDMFIWISMALQYESDIIQIQEEKYCEEMRVSRATYYAAKQQLTNRLIIPRTSRKNTYWVNPSYLYKGDRIKMYRENVIVINENPFDKLKE